MRHYRLTLSLLTVALSLVACGQPNSSTTDQPSMPTKSSKLSTQGILGSTFYTLKVRTPGFTDRSLGHFDSLGVTEVVTEASSNVLKADVTWKVQGGLAGDKPGLQCLSWESANYPNKYLRHQNNRLRIDTNDNTDLFKADATFCTVNALDNDTSAGSRESVSFESFNFPGRFIRHRNAEVWLDSFQDTPAFRADATWRLAYPMTTFQNPPAPSDFETRVLALINQARAQGRVCGGQPAQPAGALVYSPQLRTSGYQQVIASSVYSFSSPSSYDGKDMLERASLASYGPLGTSIAEVSIGNYTPSVTPEQIFEALLAWPAAAYDGQTSSSPCKVLLDPKFKEIGIADNLGIKSLTPEQATARRVLVVLGAKASSK
jgi:uncharacterized protein YkwD